jgi:hypothetical protein
MPNAGSVQSASTKKGRNMKAVTSLTNSMMTFYTFKSVIDPSDMRKFPADFFDSETPPPPFMVNKVLYFPIHLAGSPKISSGVIGLLFAKVMCSTAYSTGVKILDTPAKIKESGIRISSQGENLLKKSDAGDRIYDNKGQSRRNVFRCRGDEVVRQLALGFTTIDQSNLDSSIIQCDYNFNSNVSHMVGDQRIAMLLNMFRDGVVPSVFTGKNFNSWSMARFIKPASTGVSAAVKHDLLAEQVANCFNNIICRTAVALDSDSVQKWRKPPRSSAWPWTLDHHWFLCEGNAISSAHHSMMALVEDGGAHRGQERKDQIARQLPVINEQLTLDKLRKVLETYFSDLNGTITTLGSKFGDYVKENNNIRWLGTGGRWSMTTTDQHHTPLVGCLALGVRPKIENGKLVKFVPTEGALLKNTQKFHCQLTPKELNSAHPKVTMIAMYTCGLLSESTFREVMGTCLKEYDPINEQGNVSLAMGPLITVLIPKESWYIAARRDLNSLISRQQLVAPLSEKNLLSPETLAAENSSDTD